jgi:hypothetical protein
LNNESRIRLVAGVWLAVVAVLVASCVVAGVSLASIALLIVLCAAPLGIALLIGFGAPPPTVAEVLYTANTK